MCGLLLVVNNDSSSLIDTQKFKQAINKLESRGPDHTSIFFYNNIFAGHTRLRIVDPSTSSDQPFRGKEGFLLFNGEISRDTAARLNVLANRGDEAIKMRELANFFPNSADY